MSCYIRRHGQSWTRSRAHHLAAYQAFVNNVIPGTDALDYPIRVPHADGGDFVAYFSRIGDGLVRYIDEYGQTVEIMMAEPSYVAYINRIVDYQ